MGGEIDVQSRPGQGSTFWFTVRLARQPGTASRAVPGSRASPAGACWWWTTTPPTGRSSSSSSATGGCGRPRRVRSEGLRALRQAAATGPRYDLAILDHEDAEMDASPSPARSRPSRLAGVKLALLTSFASGATGRRLPDRHRRLPHEAGGRGRPPRLPGRGDERVPSEARPPLVTRHSLRELRPPVAARVLVAEDNEVNQKVAVRILESSATGRGGGQRREAVLACEKTRYDAVLMDGQMPGMGTATRPPGGYASARGRGRGADRRHDGERDEGRPRAVPRGGDGRLRLEAGHAGELERDAAALGGRSGGARREGGGRAPSVGDLLDEAIVASLMAVDDDGTLMDEVVATFLKIAPLRLAGIRKAAKGNPAQLERTAHSFLAAAATSAAGGWRTLRAPRGARTLGFHRGRPSSWAPSRRSSQW